MQIRGQKNFGNELILKRISDTITHANSTTPNAYYHIQIFLSTERLYRRDDAPSAVGVTLSWKSNIATSSSSKFVICRGSTWTSDGAESRGCSNAPSTGSASDRRSTTHRPSTAEASFRFRSLSLQIFWMSKLYSNKSITWSQPAAQGFPSIWRGFMYV